MTYVRYGAVVTLTLSLKETDSRHAGKQTNGPGALPCCWTLTLTGRRRVREWSHRACASQEGLFGKAGPEAPAPDGGPPSHALFALRGHIWGAAPGLHSTWALLHRHPCSAQRCHPRPSTAHRRACVHSFAASEVHKHLLCARPYLRLRKFRREQNTPRPTQS